MKTGLQGKTGLRWLLVVFLCSVLGGQAGLAMALDDSWAQKNPMPTSRQKLNACVIGEMIYVLGGASGANEPGLSTNESYDPATNTWTSRAAMPTGRRWPAVGTVDGRCYAAGGQTNFGQPGLDTMEVYDPATNSWSTKAPMPTGRFGHAAAVTGGKIYVVGGTPADQGPIHGILEIYDPATDSWTTGAPMPTARAALAASSVNGKIYVFGGMSRPGFNWFSTVEMYDPVTDTWTGKADMPTARVGLTSSVVNEKIYVIGGARSSGTVHTVEEYDPATDSWTTRASMPTARWLLGSSAVAGKIYVIGGSVTFPPPHPANNKVEEYTPPGAAGFRINAGLNDAWFNLATNGQGFLITVFPDRKEVFLAWFTYDTERPPEDVTAFLGEPGHRWLTAQGPYDGDTANLTIFVTEGGIFDAAEPVAETDPAGDGTMRIEFADCSEGLVNYQITSLDISGEIPIQRITPDNVALCEALASP
jgi:N-acetylneuraminic acid mutarotase